MPIYEYRCPKCDNKFDLLRPFSRADEAATCPKCNHEARKQVSAFASFSKGNDGVSTPISGGGGHSCGSCSSSSCASCG